MGLRGMAMHRDGLLGVLAASALMFSVTAAAQPGPLWQSTDYKGREIGKLTGDVYYARSDDYVSAFMVTPEGIVLVEPVGPEFATWLKGELDRRFGVPVKYVIYSHSHADHASGAAVFKDTARIIGHEALLGLVALPPAATQLPQNLRAQDANGNGRIERAEAQAQLVAQFDFYDADGDGALSGAEATRGPLKLVTPPDLTYTSQVNIVLGGKRVEVIPIPTDHAPDNTIVRFVDGSNVVFASDWITNSRVPFGPNVTMPSELAKIRQVEALDFEHFVCSHGRLGTKADVTANLGYREAVVAAVREAIAAGKTLEQARDSVLMSEYKSWEFYEQQRPQNVAGAYRLLTANR
jgi:glyoxylase-like metal-dependent hydrolase (beta-lactamase superfamily II)